MANKFYSQFSQDKIINDLLDNRKDGFFIDIGAYDGITYSNSNFFEESMNWSGVCFEPNPVIFKKLKEERTCEIHNAGVSAKNTTLEYKRFSGNSELEMLSGFSDFFNEPQKARIEEELRKEKNSSTEIINVDTVCLNDFLKEKTISKIDYCSIDTEGGEFEILKTINFQEIYFSALTIEDNDDSDEVIAFMNTKGYKIAFIWKCDLFFINKKETLSLNSKIKTFKFYLNYHLKKAKWIYTPLNFLYKKFIGETF